MKKNKSFRAAFFSLLFITAFVICGSLSALDFRNEYFLSPDSMELTVRVENLPLAELMDLLTSGETVGIEFETRLFLTREGILSVLGDEMVESQRIVHNLRYDRINRAFVLETPSETRFYGTFAGLVRSLRTARFSFSRRALGEYYLKSRVLLIKRRLVPPFNLLESLSSQYRVRSDWKSTPPAVSRGEG